jgi:hypothetical protein
MKVWSVSQPESTPDTLSAKNSTKNMKPAAPMTSGLVRISRSGGRATLPVAPIRPSVAIAA